MEEPRTTIPPILHISQPPPITVELSKKGRNTVGHETNLARAPMWLARQSRFIQLDLLPLPTSWLHGREFKQTAGDALTTDDQRLFAEIGTRWIRDGCLPDLLGRFSLGEAARLIGRTSPTLGGDDREAVKQCLRRLKRATYYSAVRNGDGSLRDEGEWGLLQSWATTTRGGGRGWARITTELATLLFTGSVTYLHAPTWDAIATDDAIAARLWVLFEAEDNLHAGRRYSVFSAPPGGISEQRHLPALADLAGIAHWTRRANASARLGRCLDNIAHHDGRYAFRLAKSKARGMWYVDVSRDQHIRPPAPLGLPPVVAAAWRQAYGVRRPSKRQLAVLKNLTHSRGSPWLVSRLLDGMPDPFGWAVHSAKTTDPLTTAKPTDGPEHVAVSIAQLGLDQPGDHLPH